MAPIVQSTNIKGSCLYESAELEITQIFEIQENGHAHISEYNIPIFCPPSAVVTSFSMRVTPDNDVNDVNDVNNVKTYIGRIVNKNISRTLGENKTYAILLLKNNSITDYRYSVKLNLITTTKTIIEVTYKIFMKVDMLKFNYNNIERSQQVCITIPESLTANHQADSSFSAEFVIYGMFDYNVSANSNVTTIIPKTEQTITINNIAKVSSQGMGQIGTYNISYKACHSDSSRQACFIRNNILYVTDQQCVFDSSNEIVQLDDKFMKAGSSAITFDTDANNLTIPKGLSQEEINKQLIKYALSDKRPNRNIFVIDTAIITDELKTAIINVLHLLPAPDSFNIIFLKDIESTMCCDVLYKHDKAVNYQNIEAIRGHLANFSSETKNENIFLLQVLQYINWRKSSNSDTRVYLITSGRIDDIKECINWLSAYHMRMYIMSFSNMLNCEKMAQVSDGSCNMISSTTSLFDTILHQVHLAHTELQFTSYDVEITTDENNNVQLPNKEVLINTQYPHYNHPRDNFLKIPYTTPINNNQDKIMIQIKQNFITKSGIKTTTETTTETNTRAISHMMSCPLVKTMYDMAMVKKSFPDFASYATQNQILTDDNIMILVDVETIIDDGFNETNYFTDQMPISISDIGIDTRNGLLKSIFEILSYPITFYD